MSYENAEIKRRIDNFFKVGTIIEIKTNPERAKVKINEVFSDWLPYISNYNKFISTNVVHKIGAQVLIACPSGEVNNGVIIGSINSSKNQPPTDDLNVFQVRFNDGSFFQFDQETKEFSFNCNGVLNIRAKEVKLNSNLKVDGGDVDVKNGDVNADQISLKNHKHTTIKEGQLTTEAI